MVSRMPETNFQGILSKSNIDPMIHTSIVNKIHQNSDTAYPGDALIRRQLAGDQIQQPTKKYINDCEDNLHLIDSFIDGDLFGPERNIQLTRKMYSGERMIC